MVFVEVGSSYILASAQTVFSCRSVWQIFMSMQCYHCHHAPQSIFGIRTCLFLHLIVHFKEKSMIVLGVCKKKY